MTVREVIRTGLAAAAALLFFAGPASADIVIDDFTSGPGVFTVEPEKVSGIWPPPVVQAGLDPQSPLNGTRLIQLFGARYEATGIVSATVDPADGGRLDYDATQVIPDPGFALGAIEAFWVGAGDPNWHDDASTFSVDLTAGGNDRFEIEFLETDFNEPYFENEQYFEVIVASGAPGARREYSLSSFFVGSSDQPQTISVPFSSARRADFSQVAYVELFAPNLVSGDHFSVGSIRAVGDGLEGDYNGDGFVSQADLDLVLLNWGDATLPAGWAAADQYDGVLISQNELDGVLLNWGSGTPPISPNAAVPEPAALWVLLGMGLWGTRRR